MQIEACWCADLAAVSAAEWDRLVQPDEPFLRHAFLHALATSGSVGPGTGWQPCHLLLRVGGKLVAALPLYAKTDSYGEFVFDWAWAQAAIQGGLAYYPKLVAAVPYTPATGRRLLVAKEQDPSEVLTHVVQVLKALLADGQFSGVHVLFCSTQEQRDWQAAGFVPRASFQFHWRRAPGWHSFDDFLASLRNSSRKQVRKERARAHNHGFVIDVERGASLTAADTLAMYGLYRQTVWEKGAQAYLSAAFFAELRQSLASEAIVSTAREGGTICAMALFFRRGRQLFGRYWGAREHYDALHFELCYYLPIEWALANGIEHFEAGAQGEHKIKRGFLPSICCSAHVLAAPGLHRAVADFCRREAAHVAEQVAYYGQLSPFQRGNEPKHEQR